MKIVFLAPFGIRPKGTLLARMLPLAAALNRAGHEPVIVAPPYTNPEDSGREETVNGIRLRNIRLETPAAATTLLLSARMYCAAMEEKPDLIHLFKPKGYGGLAAMYLLQARRLKTGLPPLVVDSDDWEGKGGMNDLLPYSRAQRLVFHFQEQWLLRRADAVTVASRELERRVIAMTRGRQRLLYLPNGVLPNRRGNGALTRQRFSIPDDAPLVLLYSRFFEFRQERLHDLFARIHARAPGVRFLVVGSGRNGEEEELVRAARLRGFEHALIMAGWVEPENLADMLAAGDVAPYLFDDTLINRTKCPAKLTELVNAGVAVVADRVGQLGEYLPESSDTLCPPGDWQRMAEQVARLLVDHPLRRNRAMEQYAHLHARFSWERLAAQLDLLLRSLVIRRS
jgi:glycosyltransferase involved in cell wall biosynthesis